MKLRTAAARPSPAGLRGRALDLRQLRPFAYLGGSWRPLVKDSLLMQPYYDSVPRNSFNRTLIDFLRSTRKFLY
jgi:hypothetical protein